MLSTSLLMSAAGSAAGGSPGAIDAKLRAPGVMRPLRVQIPCMLVQHLDAPWRVWGSENSALAPQQVATVGVLGSMLPGAFAYPL